MSNIQTFIEQLKADKVVEAFQTIKDELSARARTISEEVNIKVAESFNMKPIIEKTEEDDDENLSDEEKEAKAAKEAEEKSKED